MKLGSLSDIEISRVYKVYCDEHGYVDETLRYADAVKARREHFESVHESAPEVSR